MWDPGFWTSDVVPSPQVQNQLVIPQLIEVDVSVTVIVCGAWCDGEPVIVKVKPALGRLQLVVAVGVAVEVGVGVAPVAVAVGVGVGVAVAVGAGCSAR